MKKKVVINAAKVVKHMTEAQLKQYSFELIPDDGASDHELLVELTQSFKEDHKLLIELTQSFKEDHKLLIELTQSFKEDHKILVELVKEFKDFKKEVYQRFDKLDQRIDNLVLKNNLIE